MIEKTIIALRLEAEKELAACTDASGVEALKVKFLGKKGRIAGLMMSLKDAPKEERPALGMQINELKVALEQQISSTHLRFESEELACRLAKEVMDVTLPGRRAHLGREHIITKTINEAIDILVGMGFSVQYGPDIESDFYNFEALNFSEDHPAREMHDTYYISKQFCLRTHTSNTQVRVMESSTLPIRIIAPGKCFRNEDVSARSHVQFNQVEGLYIDEEVTFADLLQTLQEFFTQFFGQSVQLRHRPSYFPFVEPGMEVDLHCLECGGKGCSLCKQSGWLEVAGAGMVHPEVLKSGGIDPEVHQGYAWGLGIERLALLRSGIKDIRLFLENDVRFLDQF